MYGLVGADIGVLSTCRKLAISDDGINGSISIVSMVYVPLKISSAPSPSPVLSISSGSVPIVNGVSPLTNI